MASLDTFKGVLVEVNAHLDKIEAGIQDLRDHSGELDAAQEQEVFDALSTLGTRTQVIADHVGDTATTIPISKPE